MRRSIQTQRLTSLPPYLFAELDRQKELVAARGVDIIDLGVGDPDRPTPEPIVSALIEAVRNPATHRYPSYQGMRPFREACAGYMKRRFGVELDPETEICALIGSKEGIAHAALALVEIDDTVLIPSPGYPVYRAGTIFAGGNPVDMPLAAENSFLPDFSGIPKAVASRATVMHLNYPNNPTGATANLDFFAEALAFAAQYNITLLHDAAYAEMGFGDYRAPSVLQAPGAMERAAEFHSFSKTFNMTGWRVGFVAGNAEIVQAIGRVKTNVDSGAFEAVQQAAVAALNMDPAIRHAIVEVYRERRDLVLAGLRQAGFDVPDLKATFYVWFPVPGGDSAAFADDLLQKTGVVVTPGVGFGAAGEGYARIALCQEKSRLVEAMDRLVKL
ncbi:MAG: LL-diaminopimelate aminotransferase [Candidatus Lernaella stagnicola]|nr:LL-diaminopimelate aminotransferase [Candidatus Lernaella stagnicola]